MADGVDIELGDKRRLILNSARAEFLKVGFSKAAMGQVARSARLSTATLYLHFPSKIELFHDVILDTAEDFAGMMRRVPLDGASANIRVSSFTLGYARFLADPFVRGVLRLVAAERDRIPEAARDVYNRGRREVGGRLMTALEELHARNELRIETPSSAAGQLMGMIEHPLFMSAMMLGDDHRLEREIDHIAREATLTFLARYRIPS